jgi:hypothetical protein
MKKIFISLLSLMGLGFSAFAQSHISIELLSATYTTPAVKFRVSWNSVPTVTGQIHNAKIWVWVDFLKINADNTTSGNTWTRAEISTTPTVNSSPTSSATLDASTNKGFWLNGVAGSYSATITATLSGIPANTKFNWCAYVSDCPPNVTANNGTYTFKGTPPFTLIASDGTITQTVSGTTLSTSALIPTPTTIRDKTECPADFCLYTGSDLYIDATHLCQQRTSGAKNWEAWIKDSRDSKLYHITQFSDGSWWMAEDLQYAGKRIGQCSGTSFYRGHDQPACPTGWSLPTLARLQNRNIGFNDAYGASFVLAAWFRVCGGYGCDNQNRMDILLSDCVNSLSTTSDGSYTWNWTGAGQPYTGSCNDGTACNSGRVRCFRQL